MHPSNVSPCRKAIKRILTLAFSSAFFACGLTQTSVAQNSPAGTWELSLSKAKTGTAIIVFNTNGTLTGYEVVSKHRNKPSREHREGRILSDRNQDANSNDNDSGTNVVTKFVGSAELIGMWTYDWNGRVIGYMDGISILVGAEENGFVTNAISFRAIARQDRSLKLMASTEEGRVIYQGRPVGAVDLTGDFVASTKTRGGPDLIQFLQLSPGILPNEYDVVGSGPGYSVAGSVLVTSRGRASIVLFGSDSSLSAATGSFSNRSGSALLRGTNGDDKFISIRLTPDTNLLP